MPFPHRLHLLSILLLASSGRIAIGMPQAPAEDVPASRTRVLEEGRFGVDENGRSVDGQVVEGSPTPSRATVAILPDRTTGLDWGLPHLDRAVDDLNLLRPDAIFCVGDLVQGYTRDLATWDREVDEYLSIVGRLDADFWPTAGNHDVISGERDASDRRFADRYRERFGPLHYAVRLDHGTMIVLFSDESLDGGDIVLSDEQLQWLVQVLEDAPSDRPIVLLMHRPLWRYRGVRWFERVHPRLVEHGVDAVVAGHFHALHREPDRDGVQYHLLGVCGGAIDQHPLTGQFNHVSLLDLGPGDDVHVRHLPVGVVLADDFVTREDQERSYRLKSRAGVVTVEDVLPDPWHGDVDRIVRLEISNPIDRPIRVSVAPATPPVPWLVEGHAFVARTALDISNPSTTDLDSPFRFVAPEPIEIPPDETRIVPIRVVANRTTTPPPPPEIRATAVFTDDRGREVPIVLPRRIPVDRFDPDLSDGQPTWSIPAWVHSVYEEPEPLGEARTWSEGGDLVIELAIRDDLLADDDHPVERTARERGNPHGDLVSLEVRLAGSVRRFLFEPADRRPEDPRLLRLDDSGGVGEILEGRVSRMPADEAEPLAHRFRITLPETPVGDIDSLQIEVADNDRTYHTQWRRIAPRGTGIRVEPLAP